MARNWHQMRRFQSKIAFPSDRSGGRMLWSVGRQTETICAHVNKPQDAIRDFWLTKSAHKRNTGSCGVGWSQKLLLFKQVIHRGAGGSRFVLVRDQKSRSERQQSADRYSGLLLCVFIWLQIRLINAALTTFACGSSVSAPGLINAGDTLKPKPRFLSTPLNRALKSCCRVWHSPVNHTWNQNQTGQRVRQKQSHQLLGNPLKAPAEPPCIFALCLCVLALAWVEKILMHETSTDKTEWKTISPARNSRKAGVVCTEPG